MKPQAAQPEIIDLLDEDDTAEMMKLVAATKAAGEPAPEPRVVTSELFEMIKRMDDDEAQEEATAEALAEAMRQAAPNNASAELDAVDPQPQGPRQDPVVTVVEELVVEMEEDEPSWLETKLGPWVACHRDTLRMWLLALLVVYVSLFASMLLQDGVRGLSERSPTAAARDLLWAVLMGIIVLLAIGKHY